MQDLKLCTTGLQMMDHFRRLASQASWVALGSFGLDTSFEGWRLLPKGSEVVVGLPREIEKHSTIRTKLGYLRKLWPEIRIATRTDFHAKYGLFRMRRSLWVMLGSANFTHSPAHETVIFFQSEDVFKLLAQRHQRWLVTGTEVKPHSAVRLDKRQLAALSSQAVDG